MATHCHDCRRRGRVPAVLMHPGICTECGNDERAEAASQRLARAIDSIHPERRWARLDSDLMAERLDPIGWRVTVNGEVQCNGDDYASLRDVVPSLSAYPRLTIAGKASGLGKTSFGVAIMFDVIDSARRLMMGGKEPTPMAENARMFATIDMADPDVARMANGVPFALIDDAGQEGRGGGFRSQDAFKTVGDVLDRRERDKRKRTIVTTFGDRNSWGEWYGGRIVRMYWDMPAAAVLELWSGP